MYKFQSFFQFYFQNTRLELNMCITNKDLRVFNQLAYLREL